jgi:putative inorganic carbon (hco3(-)) transporter
MRGKIIAAMVLAGMGFLYLSDPQFLMRASTITAEEEHRDTSAESRIRLAQAAMHMISDHPLGLGAGNYYQTIGKYIPEYHGKDAHNTYLRCATEIGVQGFLVFLALIVNAFLMIRRTWIQAADLPEEHSKNVILICYALTTSLVVLLGCCLTISLTYVEFVWWFLALPVCLQRAVENLREDLAGVAVSSIYIEEWENSTET